MWLHNTTTLKLHYFNTPEDVPGGYAILSHVWDENGEQTFREFQDIWAEYEPKEGELLSQVDHGALIPVCGAS